MLVTICMLSRGAESENTREYGDFVKLVLCGLNYKIIYVNKEIKKKDI